MAVGGAVGTAGSAGAVSAVGGAPTAGSSGATDVGGSAGSPGGAGAGGSSAGSAGASTGGGGGASGGAAGSSGNAGAGGGTTGTPGKKLVAYLANYSGSYSTWATKVNFKKMTHMNLAFATVKNGQWTLGQSDAEVKALVDAAHAAGVKVLASLGGGGGDQSIFNNWANMDSMVQTLDPFLTRLNLDGADVDIENAAQTGSINSTAATNYDKFVEAIAAKLHPEGKLVTAAVAPWVGGPRVSTLQTFDFINIMVYTSKLSDYTDGVNFFKVIGLDKITIGAGFYGANSGDTSEVSYSQILAADPNAYTKNSTQVNGQTYYYTGEDAMKSIVAMSKNYGGLMVWDLTEDVTGPRSLWGLVQNAF